MKHKDGNLGFDTIEIMQMTLLLCLILQAIHSMYYVPASIRAITSVAIVDISVLCILGSSKIFGDVYGAAKRTVTNFW